MSETAELHVFPFKKGIESTTRFPDPPRACPKSRLVGINSILENSISTNLPLESGVVPMELAWMIGGGKSTAMNCIYDKLKEEGEVIPILVSLFPNMPLRRNETPVQAINRMIAMQMLDFNTQQDIEFAMKFEVDEKTLWTHIENTRNNKPIVLLIDNLNFFPRDLLTADSECYQWLQRFGLTKNQYVVFSSTPFCVASDSPKHYLAPPQVMDIAELQKMFDPSSGIQVRGSDPMMCAGNPAMIYELRMFN